MSRKTAAVVVTYHPETARLERLLTTLEAQVGKIIVVDNGSPPEALAWLYSRSREEAVHLLSLGDNFGIAFAQNRGIDLAIARDFGNVLLLDQDSLPHPDMVSALEKTLEGLECKGIRVGAVGPARIDENDASPVPYLKFDSFPPNRLHCGGPGDVLDVGMLIASGMLIPVRAIVDLGDMEERLFIDHVETEWCLRGTARGYHFFVACDAKIDHRLGNSVSRFWLGRWRNMTIHAPIRNYYFVRNSLVLIRRRGTLGRWKCYMAWTLAKFVLRNGFVPPRLQRLSMTLRATLHALAGRLGRLA